MKPRSRLVLVLVSLLCAACATNTYVVDSAADDSDSNLGDAVCATSNNECTLRAALQEAAQSADTSIIEFENVSTISIASPLPPLNLGRTEIHGNGAITLDGPANDCSGISGIQILGPGSGVIQGLTITHFGTGIYINGLSNTTSNNIIGVDANGSGGQIERNVVVDNCRGIYLRGQNVANSTVAGNFIGVDGDGSTANGNGYGMLITEGAHDNLIGSGGANNAPAIENTDLVAYWAFDEAFGSAIDSAGSNDLVEHNGIASAPGVINDARDLEHNNSEYFSHTDNADLSTGDVSFSIGAWIKVESLTGGPMYIAGKENNNSTREYDFVVLASGEPSFAIFTANGTQVGRATANTALTPGVWYYVVGFHDAANNLVGVSVNGGAAATTPTSGAPSDTSASFRVGARRTAAEYFFDGLVDEMSFWKRLLTPQEMTALYNGGNGQVPGAVGSQPNVISGNQGPGIYMYNADSNQISGNYIGTTASGNQPLGNDGSGIILVNGSDSNTIGVDSAGSGAGNVISANGIVAGGGIQIQGSSNNNVIAGNYIGTNAAGTVAFGNSSHGVYVGFSSTGNIIGTDGDGANDAAEGNLISGTLLQEGVQIASPGNVVAGNLIGTNFDGSAALPNNLSGLLISSSNNRVGTNGDGVSDALEANVLSGNGTSGITLFGNNNQISGNFVGTDPSGMQAVGNSLSGIYIISGDFNLIGTNGDGQSDAEERNIISGNSVAMNGSAGLKMAGNFNEIAGNYIGVDATGASPLPNQQYGIVLTQAAHDNLIGTDGDGTADAAEGNVISGNGWNGIVLSSFAADNQISGNLVGTDVTGTSAIPNTSTYSGLVGAIQLESGAHNNVIGTNGDGMGDAAEGNLISGNAHRGIQLDGQGVSNNWIAGNYIGTDITGTQALGNAEVGVELTDGASNNRIGTNGDGNSDAEEANVISDNGFGGVAIFIGSSNVIAGNFIGTDISGTLPLGNGDDGIEINSSNQGNTNNNVVGGTLNQANVIAYNQGDGVTVSGFSNYPQHTTIVFNSIFMNDDRGINLVPGDLYYNVNPNDPGDVDGGSNAGMNYPELNSALAINNNLTIGGGIVNGLANTTFAIQFFVSPSCDTAFDLPSLLLNGEGKTYLGSTTETTDGSGNASFLVNIAQAVNPGDFITATATDMNGANTSEFSECVEIEAGQQQSLQIEETPNSQQLIIIPTRNLNCRYYCTAQSDIADTLFAGVEYTPLGWDAELQHFAFEGPAFGELCFAPPAAGGSELMTLDLGGVSISVDELDQSAVPAYRCPAFSTPTPTVDVDETLDSTATPTPTPVPQCSDGVDNDGDGLIDYVAPGAAGVGGGDRECTSATDDDESR